MKQDETGKAVSASPSSLEWNGERSKSCITILYDMYEPMALDDSGYNT
jgi:hypothetical protein